jgi:hypothetical protein
MAGGYATRIEDSVDIHAATIGIALELHGGPPGTARRADGSRASSVLD